jgi:head-tail adaptor
MAIKKPFIGQLDRKIQIMKTTATQSSTGSKVEAAVSVSSPWAMLEQDGGDQYVEGKEVHSVDRVYVIRWSATVMAEGKNYYIVDDGMKFRIDHVEPVGRKSHLRLRASAYE